MICGDCGLSDATLTYSEMLDGELCTFRLCEECARKRGFGVGLSSFTGPLVSILVGLLEESLESGRNEATEPPLCPRCGLSYGEFRASGRLGCAECYESFGDELEPLLRRVHGRASHVGRRPAASSESCRPSPLRRARALRDELSRAVRREEYEEAARLRDEIRTLETTGSGGRARSCSASENVGEGITGHSDETFPSTSEAEDVDD